MASTHTTTAPAAELRARYTIRRYGRNWQVIDPAGQLVCITFYKKGAEEVVRRLYG